MKLSQTEYNKLFASVTEVYRVILSCILFILIVFHLHNTKVGLIERLYLCVLQLAWIQLNLQPFFERVAEYFVRVFKK